MALSKNDEEQIKAEEEVLKSQEKTEEALSEAIRQINLTLPTTQNIEQKIDLLFEEFWKAYPNRRKYNKPGCKAKYRHIPDIEKVHADIMAALEIHKRSKDWTKDNGEYIPAPYVYLNQERWKLVDTRDERQIIADDLAMDFINKMNGGN